ncbi:YIP1 family protein [Tamlana sp. 2201CG12-4]|uniref:YIP1 family protein n=1 Tax=Tamlana sp. 2201CG12-4 TaxID=3112582 RepID=UPI002DB7438C|nr:YIP1 family protein [Tamlana sp. 2201CG12-4]MEC3908579.1 YIP1 family protein [Tamlana sp. 2201CG12-4]
MSKTAFEDFDKDYQKINQKELIYSIWNKPKLTLQYILERCPEKHVYVLLVLGGIVRAVSRASDKGMGDNMSTPYVLLLTFFLGGLLGWVSYYIYAWALSFTGGWLDGKAESDKFRTIIAWALVPSIASLILLIPEVIILGDDLFRSVPLDNSTFNSISWGGIWSY